MDGSPSLAACGAREFNDQKTGKIVGTLTKCSQTPFIVASILEGIALNKLVYAALLSSTFALPLTAQQLPEDEELQNRLSASLPSYWDIDEFRVIASAMQGDPITPKALLRFEADVSPDGSLYAGIGERIGPFLSVVSTYADGQRRTLYGTMQLDYKAGEWSGEPSLENSVADLGQPLDLFNTPTLILGSDKQADILTAMRSENVGKTLAALEAELAGLKAEHQSKTIAAKANFDADLSQLEADFAPRISAEKARLSAEIDMLSGDHIKVISALELKHVAEVEKIETEHAKKIAALRTRMAGEVASLETGLEEKIAGLKQQLVHAEEVHTVQASILVAMERAAEHDRLIKARITENKARNLDFFKAFGKQLSGGIDCRRVGGNDAWSSPIFFNVTEVSSTGLRGTTLSGDKQRPASLTLATTSSSQKTILTLSLPYSNVLGTYDLTLLDNGAMRGVARGDMNNPNVYGNNRREYTCTATLG